MTHRKPMFYVVWTAVVLLIVLHQDNWLWDNSTLVWGFMPITLLYHTGISLAATVTWLAATRYAWPNTDPADTHTTSTTTGEGSVS